MISNTSEKRVAVFIDADNTQYDKLGEIFEKINLYGRIVIKRAYGNWGKDALRPWEKCSKEFAIKQVQQTDYVAGKNTTDIALIIDAMDFVNRTDCEVFAIVSSDSDFTPLVIKLREMGKEIIGIGKKETAVDAFINACDEFVNISGAKKKKTGAPKAAKRSKKEQNLYRWLEIAAETWQNDEGFTNVSAAGSYIKRINPEFDIHDYGASKLTEYIEKHPADFEVNRRQGSGKTTIFEYKVK